MLYKGIDLRHWIGEYTNLGALWLKKKNEGGREGTVMDYIGRLLFRLIYRATLIRNRCNSLLISHFYDLPFQSFKL